MRRCTAHGARERVFERLRQQIAVTADPMVVELLNEVRAYALPDDPDPQHLEGEHLGVVMPFKLRSPTGVLSFISTLTIFGTPNDVTLQELAVESFSPADEFTAGVLRERREPHPVARRPWTHPDG